MIESLSIPKKKAEDSDEFEFSGLRRQGLEYAQQLSGEIWTDYNLHDPGVTILEQLCFALTDLLYRTGYAVPDLLTDPNGDLDYQALGLYTPEDIFPSHAVTVDDYRRILFSEIAEIDNVWLEPLAGGENPHCGLYRLLVAPIPSISRSKKSAQCLKDKIAEIYAGHRNLCEDVEEIVLLRSVPCRLEATARLDGTRNAEEVLAMLYHLGNREATARLDITPYTMLAKKERPEDLFNGPLTGGKVSGLDHTAQRRSPDRGQLFSLLKDISGVERVDRFRLSADQVELKKILSEGDLPCYRVTFPEDPEDSEVRLTKNGREAVYSWSRFRTRLEELEFKDRTLREQGSKPSKLYPLPQGTYRNPGQYASVQSLFPDSYGINTHGVPEHYPEEEKAAAAQLKAYLLPFEQILADYLAQLEQLPNLFAVERDLRQSYYRQQLDSSKVPGIDKVLAPDAEQYFKQLHRKFDNYRDRKSRVLDYLLALYGERFTGTSLRNFNWHQDAGEFEDEMINNKARLLKHLVQINHNRSAAINYQQAIWDNPENISGMQRKAAILLGWEDGSHNRSLTQMFNQEGLTILDDCCGIGTIDSGIEADDELEPVPPEDFPKATLAELREKAHPLLPKSGSITTTLLRDGAQLQAYGLAMRKADKTVRVRLRSIHSGSLWLPGLFTDPKKAALAVNALRALLIRLNQQSEGMHIVEHILLRPVEPWNAGEEEDFYSNRISVLLPNWTPRCGNRQFQLLVEETVRIICPAHIMPMFYWLDAARMTEFEGLYLSAMAKRHCRYCEGGGKKYGYRRLRNFLLRHQASPEEQPW